MVSDEIIILTKRVDPHKTISITITNRPEREELLYEVELDLEDHMEEDTSPLDWQLGRGVHRCLPGMFENAWRQFLAGARDLAGCWEDIMAADKKKN